VFNNNDKLGKLKVPRIIFAEDNLEEYWGIEGRF